MATTAAAAVSAVHTTIDEVRRLLAENARLEADVRKAHRQIGGLEMELRLARANEARLKAEVDRLRAIIIARLSIHETLPASASVDDLWRTLEMTNERLSEALYPSESPARVKCRCGDGSCMLCDDEGMVSA